MLCLHLCELALYNPLDLYYAGSASWGSYPGHEFESVLGRFTIGSITTGLQPVIIRSWDVRGASAGESSVTSYIYNMVYKSPRH